MSTKSDSFLQKVENGHSVHWIQKPSVSKKSNEPCENSKVIFPLLIDILKN